MARRTSLRILPLLVAQVVLVYLLIYAVMALAGLPADFGLPWALRLLGIPVAAFGLGMMAWTIGFRGWSAYYASTSATARKLLRREGLPERAGRTEPLVVAGPYRLVRHPFYAGFEAVTWGLAVLVDAPWAYLGALVFWLWLVLVVAPFEERELLALFGAPYQEYMRTHRRFLPIPRHPRG